MATFGIFVEQINMATFLCTNINPRTKVKKQHTQEQCPDHLRQAYRASVTSSSFDIVGWERAKPGLHGLVTLFPVLSLIYKLILSSFFVLSGSIFVCGIFFLVHMLQLPSGPSCTNDEYCMFDVLLVVHRQALTYVRIFMYTHVHVSRADHFTSQLRLQQHIPTSRSRMGREDEIVVQLRSEHLHGAPSLFSGTPTSKYSPPSPQRNRSLGEKLLALYMVHHEKHDLAGRRQGTVALGHVGSILHSLGRPLVQSVLLVNSQKVICMPWQPKNLYGRVQGNH